MSGPTNPAGLSFTAPTTFTDGTSIPAGTITKVQYGFGPSTGQYTTVVDDAVMKTSGGKIAASLPAGIAFGQWFAAARSVTKDGAVASWGNEVAFVLAPKQPGPITDFGVG